MTAVNLRYPELFNVEKVYSSSVCIIWEGDFEED
jgi:hypothetical protein